MKYLFFAFVMLFAGYIAGMAFPSEKLANALSLKPAATPEPAPLVQAQPTPPPPGAWMQDPNRKTTLDAGTHHQTDSSRNYTNGAATFYKTTQ
jgi:hypothetical protein